MKMNTKFYVILISFVSFVTTSTEAITNQFTAQDLLSFGEFWIVSESGGSYKGTSSATVEEVDLSVSEEAGSATMAFTQVKGSYGSTTASFSQTVNLSLSTSEILSISVTLDASSFYYLSSYSDSIQYDLNSIGAGTFTFGNNGTFGWDTVSTSSIGFSHSLTGTYSIDGSTISRSGTFDLPVGTVGFDPYTMGLNTTGFPNIVSTYERASFGDNPFKLGFGNNPNSGVTIFDESIGLDDVSIRIMMLEFYIPENTDFQAVPEPKLFGLMFGVASALALFWRRKITS